MASLSKNKLSQFINTSYNIGIAIIIIGSICYPILLCFFIVRYITMPTAFKAMKDDAQSSKNIKMLFSHSEYYWKVSLIVMMVIIPYNLFIVGIPDHPKKIDEIAPIIMIWGVHRMMSGKSRLNNNMIPRPSPKGFQE